MKTHLFSNNIVIIVRTKFKCKATADQKTKKTSTINKYQ